MNQIISCACISFILLFYLFPFFFFLFFKFDLLFNSVKVIYIFVNKKFDLPNFVYSYIDSGYICFKYLNPVFMSRIFQQLKTRSAVWQTGLDYVWGTCSCPALFRGCRRNRRGTCRRVSAASRMWEPIVRRRSGALPALLRI